MNKATKLILAVLAIFVVGRAFAEPVEEKPLKVLQTTNGK